MAGWLHTEISVRHRKLNPDTVAHLSTNRARRRLTSLIEANALTTTPDHQRPYNRAENSITNDVVINNENYKIAVVIILHSSLKLLIKYTTLRYGNGNGGNGNVKKHSRSSLVDWLLSTLASSCSRRDWLVILVFIFRAGAHLLSGFLSTGDVQAPGNYGLLDHVAALHWIADNIRSFGGDPSSVTLIGDGVGAATVNLLALSPTTRGQYRLRSPGQTFPGSSVPRRVHRGAWGTRPFRFLDGGRQCKWLPHFLLIMKTSSRLKC